MNITMTEKTNGYVHTSRNSGYEKVALGLRSFHVYPCGAQNFSDQIHEPSPSPISTTWKKKNKVIYNIHFKIFFYWKVTHLF